MLRLAGGRAAVFHEGTLELAHAVPDPDPRRGIQARFEESAELITRALRRLGVDARVGEVPGEYCPGRFSVNAAGARKLAGIGQRVIAGGAHVGTVIVAEDGASVRRVLEPVYAALRLDWDPATVGAVEHPWDAVRDAVLAEYAERYELVEDVRGRGDADAGADARGGPPAAGAALGHRRRGAARRLDHRVDQLRPDLSREVVAHAGDRDQARVRDRRRGGAAAAERHQRVGLTVDDRGRHPHRAQLLRAVARGHDRRQLPAGAGAVVAAVVGRRRPACGPRSSSNGKPGDPISLNVRRNDSM